MALEALRSFNIPRSMATEVKITDAPPPFNDPSADIIIRSSENVDFRIHKILLALASPFFKEMFEVPQPRNIDGDHDKSDSQTRDGIPIIFMYDDQNRVCGRAVVNFVLESCHPARLQSNRPSLSANMVGSVVDVATRYRMDWAVKSAVRDSRLLQTHPFLLFAHACHQGLAAEATLAAKGTLRFRIEDFPRDTALKLISGYQYHTLLEFHRRSGKAAASIARGENLMWISEEIVDKFCKRHNPCSSKQITRVES
ncbi:hypothetical protein B0H16DRAFT_630752 [Mycena metata]|uniref:BTB domain-containing protein n=1 Tax=Mycena metata TaxID=1033252 RepID=A0AAD7NGF4_9AGAR|nr:hypothetical protein B0H16DRAFT_630752 [Mycena metata]